MNIDESLHGKLDADNLSFATDIFREHGLETWIVTSPLSLISSLGSLMGFEECTDRC